MKKEQFLSQSELIKARDSYGIVMKGLTTNDAAYGTTGVLPAIYTTAIYPKLIRQVLAALKFEEVATPMMTGAFEDTNVIFKRENIAGEVRPYIGGSYDGSSDVNLTFLSRSVYRFQTNINANDLEIAMAAKSGLYDIDLIAEKRGSAAYSLAKEMNRIGFLGLVGQNTYGLINDPSLSAMIQLPTGASGSSLWAKKTPQEIAQDELLMFNDIVMRAGGNISVGDTSLEWLLLVAPTVATWLATPNAVFVNSTPLSWMKETFPNITVISVPEYQVGDGSTGNYAQLILKEWNGTPTVFNLMTYRYMDHGLVRDVDYFKGKASAATAGAGVVYPMFISTSIGS